MLFVSTAEDFANPLGELVSTEQPLSLNYLAFAVNPLGLYCIEPRALGRQQTWHYPDPMAAGFDTAVVGADPASDQERRAGRSKRENQVSSSKPKAHCGWLSARRISRSRAPFFGRTLDRGSRSSAWPAPSALPAAKA